MMAAGAVRADGFVWHIASAAFDAVVDADLADGAQRLVVKRGNAESSAQLFVESAQAFEMGGEGGKLYAVVGEQKFLVAGIPEAGELAFYHYGGEDGHLKAAVGALAKFGTATVFFHADHAASAADGKTQGSQALNGFGGEAIIDVPHRRLE